MKRFNDMNKTFKALLDAWAVPGDRAPEKQGSGHQGG